MSCERYNCILVFIFWRSLDNWMTFRFILFFLLLFRRFTLIADIFQTRSMIHEHLQNLISFHSSFLSFFVTKLHSFKRLYLQTFFSLWTSTLMGEEEIGKDFLNMANDENHQKIKPVKVTRYSTLSMER